MKLYCSPQKALAGMLREQVPTVTYVWSRLSVILQHANILKSLFRHICGYHVGEMGGTSELIYSL